ncbi:hypothetical protein EVAR_49499_1 [Eumeta japonica]|uniref:Uncharacterized protein n=1 Tax=Eumeta variegata TaxID=151549 RepID=A0A4C1VW45_EUMVA|nr:hypothetical protein EVAR_49499_1 [Eumeta japonica]
MLLNFAFNNRSYFMLKVIQTSTNAICATCIDHDTYSGNAHRVRESERAADSPAAADSCDPLAGRPAAGRRLWRPAQCRRAYHDSRSYCGELYSEVHHTGSPPSPSNCTHCDETIFANIHKL